MKHILSFLFVYFGVLQVSFSQPDETWFPFSIPALDTNLVEFAPMFPLKPIGVNDFVSINSNGHFEVGGEEIRFWGTPIYPFKADKNLVRKEVRELRKMGVNMVRFHLLDSREWSESDIFGTNEGTRTFDPVQLDRMDFMVSELKKQGIYVYLDLLCGRLYTESDGVVYPDSVNRAAKEVNFFDPYLIELQKEYARTLLTHVNPYTGLAFKDDPIMACMEVVNEGWFLHSVRCDAIKPVSEGGALSRYHYNMLTDLWNDFLTEKYEIHDNLSEAWGLGEAFPVQINNNGFEDDFDNWLQSFSGAVQATIDISSSEVHLGNKAFHVNVTQSSTVDWECILQHNSLFFEEGKYYTLKFWAKSENDNSIILNVAQTKDPYTSVARTDIAISGDWKEYKHTFLVNQTWEDDPRFMFFLGLVKGNLWLDDISITEGIDEISDGGNLSDKNIKLLRIWQKSTEPNRQRQLDQSEFYLKLQTDYFRGIKDFVKEEIGVRIPVAGSNFLVGIPDVYVQDCADFIDQHGYWGLMAKNKNSMISYPNFNNAILNLFSGVGVQGKPLTASEFNYEMPNSFANEALFFLTAYSSFQDADMALIHATAYGALYDDIMLSGLDNYNRLFDKAMYPSFAYVYRHGIISSAKQTINVNFTDDDVKNLVFHKDEMWETAAYPNDYPFELMYQHGLRSSFGADQAYNVNDYPARPTSPYKSDTDEIEWDETGLFSINAPQFVGVVGKMHEFTTKIVGPIQIIEADKSSGLTLLALDNKSIGESEKMLMTFTTQQGTEGMVIEDGMIADHGKGPRLLEPAKIKFKLKTQLSEVKVNWLSENGNPTGYFEIFESDGDGTATIEINTYERKGLWFGIGEGSLSADFVNVTFQVDMKHEEISSSGVFLRGTFNNWSSNTPLSVDGTICSTILQLRKGETIEYKFVNGETWEGAISGNCTVEGQGNRRFTVPDEDAVFEMCFESCSSCLGTHVQGNELQNIKIYPNPVNEQLNISGLNTQSEITIKIFSVDGRLVNECNSGNRSQIKIDMSICEQGVYQIVLISSDAVHSSTIVKCGHK